MRYAGVKQVKKLKNKIKIKIIFFKGFIRF